MEEMRGAAMAYYARMSDDQRQSLEKFKSLMDGNGDGKVRFQEYLDFIRKQGYDHVPSVCVLWWIRLFLGGFFVRGGVGVILRWSGSSSRGGLDVSTLNCASLFLFQATMEDLVKTAKLYYEKSSLDIKAAAWNFFDSLDYNNDGKVSLQEFLGFMRDKGHAKMGSSQFFKELDNDNNGTLEFMEVMALYYIIKSGRPFCGGCDEFIPGMYFTCSVCFDNGNDLFCVCSNCFQRDNYRHHYRHHGHSQFLDNYALLEAKRMQGIATCSNQHEVIEARING
ncbi:hypothetical protein C3L33_15113, partial [Rhododendron williamsianum]